MKLSTKFLWASIICGGAGVSILLSVDFRIAIGIILISLSNALFDGYNTARKLPKSTGFHFFGPGN